MVLFNYSTKELTAKVVYYGPGLCGKTTNLQYIHQSLPGNVKGKMLSLATKTDRTLFFDFLPIDLGQIRGMQTRVQLYTVPGQVFYNETRKLVLKGADGIVFVADSQQQMLKANVESFRNLEDNLRAHGLDLAEMPHIIQFNKRDLPKLASLEDMNGAINKYNAPFYESVATTGVGVQDSLKAITKLVLLHLTHKYDPKSSAPRARPAAAAPQRPAPPVAPARPAASAPSIPVAAVPVDTGAATVQIPLSEPSATAFDTPAIEPAAPAIERAAPAIEPAAPAIERAAPAIEPATPASVTPATPSSALPSAADTSPGIASPAVDPASTIAAGDAALDEAMASIEQDFDLAEPADPGSALDAAFDSLLPDEGMYGGSSIDEAFAADETGAASPAPTPAAFDATGADPSTEIPAASGASSDHAFGGSGLDDAMAAVENELAASTMGPDTTEPFAEPTAPTTGVAAPSLGEQFAAGVGGLGLEAEPSQAATTPPSVRATPAARTPSRPAERPPIEEVPFELSAASTPTVDSTPMSPAPVETPAVVPAPVEAAPVEMPSLEAVEIDTSAFEMPAEDPAPFEAAPVEPTPVEATPVEAPSADTMQFDASAFEMPASEPMQAEPVPFETPATGPTPIETSAFEMPSADPIQADSAPLEKPATDPAPIETPSFEIPATEAAPFETSAFEMPSSEPAQVEEPQSTETFDAAALEQAAFEAVAREAASVAEGGTPSAAFDIDHAATPDWDTEASPMTDDSAPGAPPAGSLDLESLETFESEPSREISLEAEAVDAMEQGQVEPPAPAMDVADPATDIDASIPSPGGEVLTLTEVVSDDELFADGDLDVAQMTSGEEQLIVVPVEIGDVETGVRRFKLSVRLRLDPVD